jgi:hypothetical protein
MAYESQSKGTSKACESPAVCLGRPRTAPTFEVVQLAVADTCFLPSFTRLGAQRHRWSDR